MMLTVSVAEAASPSLSVTVTEKLSVVLSPKVLLVSV